MMNKNTTLKWLLFLVCCPLASGASESLDQWNWRNPLPHFQGLRDIAFHAGQYTAVGYGGEFGISNDATNWTTWNLGPLYGLGIKYGGRSIAYGNGVWVVVGSGQYRDGAGSFGVILTSTNRVDWEKRHVPDDVPALDDVIYVNGRFVAVGSGFDTSSQLSFGAVLTSQSGFQWTKLTTGTGADPLATVTYGNGVFVAMSDRRTVVASSDAINWSVINTDMTSLGLAYGNGIFLLAGTKGVLASTDGLLWTNRFNQPQPMGLAYGNGVFLGWLGSTVYASPDGAAWPMHTPVAANGIGNISYCNGQFIAMGSASYMLSTNGISWTNLFSAVTTEYLEDIVYGNGKFVAVGDHETILTSTNGVEWNLQRSGSHLDLDAVAFGAGVYVAGGAQGQILWSTNGCNWGVATNAGDTLLRDIHYANDTFMAVGSRGFILSSSNGTEWTPQESGTVDRLWSIAHGNGRWVVNGENGILISDNGSNWMQHPPGDPAELGGVPFSGFAYGNGLFVRVGTKGLIMVSTNGVDWVAAHSPTVEDLSKVVYGQDTFLAVGDSGTILSSTNATDWVLRQSGTVRRLQGIAYGAGSFVAVGSGGIIFQSGAEVAAEARLISSPARVGSGFSFSLSASPGHEWEVQASSNLQDWIGLGSFFGSGENLQFMDHEATNFTRRYYRAFMKK